MRRNFCKQVCAFVMAITMIFSSIPVSAQQVTTENLEPEKTIVTEQEETNATRQGEDETIVTEQGEDETIVTEQFETESIDQYEVKSHDNKAELIQEEKEPEVIKANIYKEEELPEDFLDLSKYNNISLNRPVWSNLETYNKADHREKNLTDGKLDSFVQVNGEVVSGKNDWELVIDLLEPQSIDMLVFRKLNIGGNDNNNAAIYGISISQDNNNWCQLGEMVQEAEPSFDDMYFVPDVACQARYVKLTLPQASNWAVAAELEAYQKKNDGGTEEIPEVPDLSEYKNLAKGAKASMNEPSYNGRPAEQAIDGKLDTYAQASNGQKFDLVLKLKEKTTINTLIMKYYGFGSGTQPQRIRHFKIGVSEDGENWTEAGQRKVGDNELHSDIAAVFEPVEAAYVKFEMIEAEEWMAVNELEIYDTSKLPVVKSNYASGSLLGKGDKIFLTVPFDAAIYYTDDGSDPITSGTKKIYSQPIEVNQDISIKAYAAKEGMRDSDVIVYDYQVRYIDASPMSGIVSAGTEIALTNHLENSRIYFTTDGSDPVSSITAKEYTQPITVEGYTDIYAYCKLNDGSQGSQVYRFLYATENLVEGKKIEASSAKPNFEASKAIDGDPNTMWQASNNKSGEWIKIDLGNYYDFDCMKIIWADDDANYKYVIETSSDTYMWYTYFSNKGGVTPTKEHVIPNLENHRRYFRIKVLEAATGKTYGIREIELMGGKSKEVPEIPMYDEPDTDLYDRVVVNPLPTEVEGVANPQVTLNGKWNFTMYPQNGFWRDSVDVSGWDQASIPGELDAQGYPVFNPEDPDWTGTYGSAVHFRNGTNMEYAYKKQVLVPEDYKDKKVFLRVDKSFNFSRIWVNGQYVREHRGGYTAWDADITDYVNPGENNWITVSLVDEWSDNLGFVELQSFRGILSDITMYAASKSYLNRLHAEVDLDDQYEDATLTVMGNAFLEDGKTAEIKLELKDMNGENVELSQDKIQITESFQDYSVELPIKNPEKWDAEHPNLYELTAYLIVNGKSVETVSKKIGFREITIDGTTYMINGVPIKLRGVNYHTVYGTDSLAYGLEEEKQLLETIKKNNFNYIRAAHYPLSDKTLDLCDELGIFVEQENSICFSGGPLGSQRPWTEHHEFYRGYLLNAVSEMVEKDRSHPSIVMWSISNESGWGSNHDKTSRYIKAVNPSIPIKFSWGGNVPDDAKIDIHSNHYKMDGIGRNGRPTVWDEYAHSYSHGNEGDMRFDPGFREHYYQVIKQNWEEIYKDPRCLGGAIWDFTDNTYEGKNRMLGNTNWGQIDVWGRDKPEIWATKNIYSPVQYKGENEITKLQMKGSLLLPYENRYETVSFSDDDFEIIYTINGGSEGNLTSNIAPKQTDNISVPAPKEGWKAGDKIMLEFYKTTSGIRRNVYTNVVTVGKACYSFAEPTGAAPQIEQNDSIIQVKGKDFAVTFSKTTGKITIGTYKEETVLTGGPHLNMGMNNLGTWSLNKISGEIKDNQAIVTIDGAYGTMGCNFKISIDSEARMETVYSIKNTSNIDAYELGIAYDLSSNADTLSWMRQGYLSYYPEIQMGRLEGTAVKENNWKREYGVKPTMEWKDDDKDFYNFWPEDGSGLGTNDFRSSKIGIYYAEMGISGSNTVVSVFGDGDGSVRANLNKDSTVRLNINNRWGYPVNGLAGIGNKVVKVTPGYTNKIVVQLADTKNNYNRTYSLEDESEQDVDKSLLQQFYDECKDFDQDNYMDNTWSKFTEALCAAGDILREVTATQQQVDDCLANLREAAGALVEIPADRQLLSALYESIHGMDLNIYTKESAARIQKALSMAKEALEKENSAKKEIALAQAELLTALAGLEKKPAEKEVDYSMAEVIYKAYRDLNTGRYTETSVRIFADALAEVARIAENKNVSQDKVDSAVARLISAATALELKPAPKPVTPIIKKGDIISFKGLKYKVLNATPGKATVSVVGAKRKTYRSITIPSTVILKGLKCKVTDIGTKAFYKFKSLQKITIGSNVTSIGKQAFYDDAKLKLITVKTKQLKKVGSQAYKGISKEAVIDVPSSRKRTYQKIFKNKGQGKAVKIK
ncbi:glycoside hydrolase family 2 [Robinsoniella sp. KNHs210]|uniref:glycoside hydrolase family 2 n=1 Tax=Robinsoniella sp. KNHs210 TaxID=1469950 RepID=UPI00047F4591|nr:glycoside hydrolase family 2 [Robinsoniella sp. KNHs210]